jgi:hypothetical protein
MNEETLIVNVVDLVGLSREGAKCPILPASAVPRLTLARLVRACVWSVDIRSTPHRRNVDAPYLLAHPLHIRAESLELFINVLVAAVDVLEAADLGGTFCG